VEEKQKKIKENKRVVLLIKYLVKEKVLHLSHQEEVPEIVSEIVPEIVLEKVLDKFNEIPLYYTFIKLKS
jgi:hypothetical protein